MDHRASEKINHTQKKQKKNMVYFDECNGFVWGEELGLMTYDP